MSTELRALWVFSQGANSKDIHLITSRRFPTVEIRFRKQCESMSTPYYAIPADSEVINEFSSCILREAVSEPIKIPSLSESFAGELRSRPFLWDPKQERDILSKSWPMGPTSGLLGGKIWPFIFVSSSQDYSTPVSDTSRLLICAVVAVHLCNHNAPQLIDYPEITSAFKVLEDLINFFPSNSQGTHSTHPALAVVARFQFYLKTALPFGTPLNTDISLMEQMHATDMSVSDHMIMTQPINQSSHRIPSWKPFPYNSSSSAGVSSASSASTTSNALSITLVENLSFVLHESVEDKSGSHCSVTGQVLCDSDILGTPEIVVPLRYCCTAVGGVLSPILSVDSCAKISESEFADNPQGEVNKVTKITKISFIPRPGSFLVCKYHYPSMLVSDTEIGFGKFPLTASFSLFQISQTRFKFRLGTKLNRLLNQFYVKFFVSTNHAVPISSIQTIDISARSKIELSSDGAVLWAMRTPSTYSENGEFVEGVVEIADNGWSIPAEDNFPIANEAYCYFSVTNRNYTNTSVDKKLISIFPNNSKHAITVNYDLRAQKCLIKNSNSDNSKFGSFNGA